MLTNVVVQRSGSGLRRADDEKTGEHYRLNPGEAFAETYRVLNEQKLGLPQEQWNIVTTSLFPDATALSLLLALFLAVMSLVYFRLTRRWSTS